MTENMNIFFLSSDLFSEHLCVTLTSILENNKNTQFNFYVLTFDMKIENKSKIETLQNKYKNFIIKFFDIDKTNFNDLRVNMDHVPLLSYVRYIIPNIDTKIDKCLFLDCDLVVNGDITQLYNTDINNYYAAATKDMYAYTLNKEYRKNIGLKNDELYFNAGVMLYNLKKLRDDDIPHKLFENSVKLANKVEFQDQDILNITLKNRVKELDTIYNFSTVSWEYEPEKRNKFIILHWNQPAKPWNSVGKNNCVDLYFKYKDLSPYCSKIKIFSIYNNKKVIFNSDIIVPIQTGNEETLNILRDNIGDNISHKNKHYAELTANYWVWKNYLQQNPQTEYIGFCHYRRFINFIDDDTHDQLINITSTSNFAESFPQNYTYEKVYPIIKNYDVIVPYQFNLDNQNVYEHYCKNHPQEEIDKLITIVKKYYPEMTVDLEEYLHSKHSYFCLNYVMKIELFKNFMNWVFDLLNKMDEISDWSQYQDYLNIKTPAYLIERFFNVWLIHQQRVNNITILNRKSLLLVENRETDDREYKIIPGVKIVHNGKKRILNMFGIKFSATKYKSNIGESILKIGKIKIRQPSKTAKKFAMNYIPNKDPKLVATLLVRDEIDIIEENIKFHLKQGVDFIIATDNGSIDGTRDVLLKYEKLGKLKLIDEKEQNYNQVKWVDRMIKIAKKEYKADWIINLDADEFWFSDFGNLKKDLSILNKYNTIYIPSLFIHPEEINKNKPFYVNTKGEFKSLLKVIHRTKGYKKIEMGSHDVKIRNKKTTFYNGITLFHYFIRSYEQFEYKVKISGEALKRNKNLTKGQGKQILHYYDLYMQGKLRDIYDEKILMKANDIYIDNSKMKDYYLNDCMTTTEKIRDTLENTINLAELLV